MTKDYFGLKKCDDSLRKLDSDLKKTFQPEKNTGPRHTGRYEKRQRKEKLINKKDVKAIKDGVSFIKKLIKLARGEKIPKTHKEIIEMKERLEREEREKQERNEAIRYIKMKLEQKAKERKEKRRKAINKIKSIFKRKEKDCFCKCHDEDDVSCFECYKKTCAKLTQ